MQAQISFFPGVSPVPLDKSSPTLHVKAYSPTGMFKPEKEHLKSNGLKKAEKVESLRSYSDYKRIYDYFISKGHPRDAALLTIGIATGLRISDLVSLRYGHVLTQDEEGNVVFRKEICINEEKTNKFTASASDSVLITEAVQEAVSSLVSFYGKCKILNFEDFLYASKQPRRKEYIEDEDGNLVMDPLYGCHVITPEYGHRIMKDAQKKLNFSINIGSHTFRKTFASLAYIIASQKHSDNAAALEEVQLLMRHKDTRSTRCYLTITKQFSHLIRNEISDFLLGRSTIENISLLD